LPEWIVRRIACPQELDSFIAAGFTKEQVLEVIAIAAASTIPNYAGNYHESAAGRPLPATGLAGLTARMEA
jgi:hypothetical protein